MDDDVTLVYLGQPVELSSSDVNEIHGFLASEPSPAAFSIGGRLKQVLDRSLFVIDEPKRQAVDQALDKVGELHDLSEGQARLRDPVVTQPRTARPRDGSYQH